jgi:NADH dehydrogenase [ubiquinone] 1 alpha subcomplex assembly factor 7
MTDTPLKEEIRRRISLAGPMPVRQFMEQCLAHPQHGYYMTRDPIGRAGDFITAPEISQVFGELIGLWAASAWQLMGEPDNVRLIELGPGRGTMMLDAMRAAQVMPAFRQAVVLHLIEVSPALRERQQQALAALDVPVMWHQAFDEVPDGPMILLANEYFDALPVSQAIKQFNGWYERMVELGADGNLKLGIANEVLPLFEQLLPRSLRDAPIGTIYEWRNDSQPLAIGRRLAQQGGAALVIDYGYDRGGSGETLQAVAGHTYVDPLAAPGEADLTAHLDFQAFGDAAEGMGASVFGPVSQATFLQRLGIDKRSETLRAAAPPDKAAEIDSAVKRLTAEGPKDMGRLFKVMALAHPLLGNIPGFELETR